MEIFAIGVCVGLGLGLAAAFELVHRLTRDKPNVTPSCGCIMCDLKVPRQQSHLGHFHQTQHGIVRCDLNL